MVPAPGQGKVGQDLCTAASPALLCTILYPRKVRQPSLGGRSHIYCSEVTGRHSLIPTRRGGRDQRGTRVNPQVGGPGRVSSSIPSLEATGAWEHGVAPGQQGPAQLPPHGGARNPRQRAGLGPQTKTEGQVGGTAGDWFHALRF
jgi:hypothetical protein